MARGQPKRDVRKVITTKTPIAQQPSTSGTIHTDARGLKTPGTMTITPPSQKEMTQVEGKHTPHERIIEPMVAASIIKGEMMEEIHEANWVGVKSTHGDQGRDLREVHRKLTMPTDMVIEKPWISLFEGNTMASKGMDLQFIPPVVKEWVKIGKLNEEEVAKEAAMWKNVVILYVIGDSLTIAAVTRFLEGQSEYTRKPKVYYHNEDYFVVKFHSESDRNMVLGSGPHMINYKLVIVKPWTTSFNLKDEVLKAIPLWAGQRKIKQVWNVKENKEPIHQQPCSQVVPVEDPTIQPETDWINAKGKSVVNGKIHAIHEEDIFTMNKFNPLMDNTLQ
ncbi:hypothetical protein H5410_027328 [Solanum commersonii]|uniref:DUF4283 domain-containing protein n=1 Tax=Solanum commersonii TaxID=4109 RepID=A0A9J5Z330_SOLCO|nr:hypothetical protein H5410_027328 [Solanum commersonii]